MLFYHKGVYKASLTIVCKPYLGVKVLASLQLLQHSLLEVHINVERDMLLMPYMFCKEVVIVPQLRVDDICFELGDYKRSLESANLII